MVALPFLSMRTGSMEGVKLDLPPKKHLYYTNGLSLIIAASIVLTAWNLTHRPWSLLGIDWIVNSPIAWIAFGVACFIYLADIWWNLYMSEVTDKDRSMKDIIPLTTVDFGHYTFLAVAAGVCEEIIYRGFLVPYIAHWFIAYPYAHWIAICLPAIAFGISHMYQGWYSVLKIVLIAVCLGTIFYFSQSLIIVVILHILIDLVSGYISMKVLGTDSVEQERDE
jgi:uncharacterized protein